MTMIAVRLEMEKARSYYVSSAFGIIFLVSHCLPTLTVKVRCTKRSGRLEIKEKNHLHAEYAIRIGRVTTEICFEAFLSTVS